MRKAAAELVRIDERGEAHPIGVVASQRMRRRVGAYRMLPAPEHVVFMRYTGEDGRRDEDDGAVVRLAGEITAPATICDVLAMMVHTRWRGELQVRCGDDVRSIFTENGNVVGAESNVPAERLGQVMFRYGMIDERLIDEILASQQPGRRFGATAVELGYLDGEQIYAAVGRQIEEIVYGALEVDDGTFFFLDGFDADRLASHHTLSANMLLMDGVTRLDEIRYFRQKIPTADWVPMPSDRGGVPEEYASVFEHVDGRRSVAEIGRASGAGEFETTKALYALAQSKHVSIVPPRMDGGPRAMVSAANAALRPIHQRVDVAGKGTALRDSLASFATGAGVYDVLFRGAGPDDRGELDPEVVEENLSGMAGDDDEAYLMRKLHDYVSFALFTAGGLLGHEAEGELGHAIGDVLGQLQPQG